MFGRSGALRISRLASGGLIVNYRCPSQCGHCLYACSPRRGGGYMDGETAGRALEVIRSLGCRSVHIGGGEPFLDPDGLAVVLEAARRAGVAVEYVETNSAWHRDDESSIRILQKLQAAGLSTLLVSISPFHNQFIPFSRVKGVIRACRATGIGIFPWISDFHPEVDALDEGRPHPPEEYEARYGADYFRKVPGRYWVHFGGRAAYTFARVFDPSSPEEILARNPGGCRELADVSHFHIDLYGGYVPGLCSGLTIRMEDLGRPLSAEKYPLIDLLYRKGVSGLMDLAVDEQGFEPGAGYLNKCHLCCEIRRRLAAENGGARPELGPSGFYEAL